MYVILPRRVCFGVPCSHGHNQRGYAPPTLATLQGNSPGYQLRDEGEDFLREQGEPVDMRELFDGDAGCLQVGHLYLYPGNRHTTVDAPFDQVQAWAAAHPDAPIVLDETRRREEPHFVLANFVRDRDTRGDWQVAVSSNGDPIIRLYTFCANNACRALDPATHKKNGVQYLGLHVQDWGIVEFDADLRKGSLQETWAEVYEELLRRDEYEDMVVG